MSSYQSAMRKSVRWYHKVAQELLFGTAVVNAHILYNEYNSLSTWIPACINSSVQGESGFWTSGDGDPLFPCEVSEKATCPHKIYRENE